MRKTPLEGDPPRVFYENPEYYKYYLPKIELKDAYLLIVLNKYDNGTNIIGHPPRVTLGGWSENSLDFS